MANKNDEVLRCSFCGKKDYVINVEIKCLNDIFIIEKHIAVKLVYQ